MLTKVYSCPKESTQVSINLPKDILGKDKHGGPINLHTKKNIFYEQESSCTRKRSILPRCNSSKDLQFFIESLEETIRTPRYLKGRLPKSNSVMTQILVFSSLEIPERKMLLLVWFGLSPNHLWKLSRPFFINFTTLALTLQKMINSSTKQRCESLLSLHFQWNSKSFLVCYYVNLYKNFDQWYCKSLIKLDITVGHARLSQVSFRVAHYACKLC